MLKKLADDRFEVYITENTQGDKTKITPKRLVASIIGVSGEAIVNLVKE